MTTDAMFRCPHCGEPIQAQKGHTAQARYNHDEALALLDFGASVGELAAHYGVSRQAINSLRKQRKGTP